MTPQVEPSFDDPEISADEILYRICLTGSHVVEANGMYAISPQIYSAWGGACSVEIHSLLTADGLTIQDRVRALNGFGALQITASEVRDTTWTRDKTGGAIVRLGIAYTPIPAGVEFGPNPYHGDIFPNPSLKAKVRLTAVSQEIVPLDQVRAAAEFEKRKNS